MSTAQDISQAKKWCEEARAILRHKLFGKSDRDLFDSAYKKIVELLQKLEGSVAHPGLLQNYLEIAGEAHDAFASNRQAGVQEASEKLKLLVQDCESRVPKYLKWAKAHQAFSERLDRKLEAVQEGRGLRDGILKTSDVCKHLDDAQDCCDRAESIRANARKTENVELLLTGNVELDKVAGLVTAAEKASKQSKSTSKDSLAVMTKLREDLQLAKIALAELRNLPGAQTQATLLAELINKCSGMPKLDKDGLWIGHIEAAQELTKYPEIVKQGREASKSHLSKDIPEEVKKAYLKIVDESYLKLLDVAPIDLANFYLEEAKKGLELGRSNKELALSDLKKLDQTITTEVSKIQSERQKAEVALNNFKQFIEKLKEIQVPPIIYAEWRRIGEMTETGEYRNKQWAAALNRLTSANDALQQLVNGYAKRGVEWKKRFEALTKLKQSTLLLVKVPPLSSDANQFLGTINELLSQFQSYDFEANIKAYDEAKLGTPPQTLLDFFRALNERAKNAKVPNNSEQLAQFLQFLKNAQWDLAQHLDVTQKRLKESVAKLAIEDPRDRMLLEEQYMKQTNAIWDRWIDFRSKTTCEKNVVGRELKACILQLNAIKVDPKGVDQLLVELRQKEKPRLAEALRQQIQQIINELATFKVDVSKFQMVLDKIPNANIDAFQRLEKAVLSTRETALKQQRETIEHEKNVSRVLESKSSDLPTGKEFKDGIKLDCQDINSLLNSSDPYAIELAKKRNKDLVNRFRSVVKEPERYKQNNATLKDLGHRIGELLEKMPETHSRLKKRLIDIKIEAKAAEPKAMTEVIKKLAIEVEQAESQLVDRKKLLDDFDKKYKQVEELYAKLKSNTETRVTEKAESFEKYFKARLEEASDLKSKEAPVQPAIDALVKLEKELNGILASPNPRLELRKRDSEEEQNQRLVRDLARQFEVELTVFRTQTYTRAKEVARATPDGDIKMVKGLGSVASTAEKLVSPYMKLISMKPAIGKQESPDMKKVKADFQRARGMLEQATQSLERLMKSPTTTNISVDDDRIRGIERVRSKWQTAARQYATTLREMAMLIRSKGKEDPQQKTNCDQAADLINGLASHFAIDAFADAFKILSQSMPKDKSERAKVAKQLLAGRETALRIMRQYRTDLTKHPVHTKLTDRKANPFMAVEAMSAAAALRAALKEIELQSLISVEK